MWIEMSRSDDGGPGWGFTECLWSPSHKKNSASWPFWDLLLCVRRDDIVIHLRGKTHKQEFVGYSMANTDGFETADRPPHPGEYGFASSFYQVPLTGYIPFVRPLLLDEVFRDCNAELRAYFAQNREKPRDSKERLFFVIQAGRLQCLNGGYLSQLNDELASIVFGPDLSSGKPTEPRPARVSAQTGDQIAEIKVRLGQQEFSENVRENYGQRCCFPNCPVSDRRFLVGAHIARWTDVAALRGRTANGLCLCLFHDKAFELGLFTLTADFKIAIWRTAGQDHPWATSELMPSQGRPIRLGPVAPSPRAIQHHWTRIGFTP